MFYVNQIDFLKKDLNKESLTFQKILSLLFLSCNQIVILCSFHTEITFKLTCLPMENRHWMYIPLQ